MIFTISYYDFKERMRQFSFLVVTAFGVLVAFFCIPSDRFPINVMEIDPYRFSQMSDPTWVPMTAAVCAGLVLPLVGTLYCGSGIRRDAVHGILSQNYLSARTRVEYIVGKFMSNLCLMLGMLAAIICGSILILIIRFWGEGLSVYSFVTPFLSLIPNLVFCCAIAVLMDSASVRFKKSGNILGLIIFFTFYITMLSLAVTVHESLWVKIFDITGFSWLMSSINAVVSSITGSEATITVLAGGSAKVASDNTLPALVLQGITGGGNFLLPKLVLIIIAFLLLLIISQILPKNEISKRNRDKAKAKRTCRKKKSSEKKMSEQKGIPCLILMEMKMLLLGLPKYWWVAFTAIFAVMIFAPLEIVQDTMLPLMFIWSIPVFSDIGCREYKYHTDVFLRSINHAFTMQAFRCWIGGVLMGWIFTLPLLVRTAAAGEWPGLIAALIFTVFMVSIAQIFGEITGTSRLFEVAAMVLCYLMLNYPPLIIGISEKYIAPYRILLLGILSFICLACVLIKRTKTYAS